LIPLIDIQAQNLELEAGLVEAFTQVLRSGRYIMGQEVPAFESEITRFTGAKHAIGVSSGTDAILLALMALGIGPGDEVLCPTYTFFATAGSIARVGAVPVFVDADLATFNLDCSDAARKITARTKAIIPVHLFGQCVDLDQVRNLASMHDLYIIEDAAQSLGATYRNQFAGTMGSFGTFSFFPSKNLGALGDAGMVVTNDDSLAERARLLRTHGSSVRYYHKLIGANFRLDTVQAAFLRVKLAQFPRYTARRRFNADYYSERLAGMDGVVFSGQVEGDSKIVLPAACSGNGHTWNQFTIRVPRRRDTMRAHLTSFGIGTEIYYPIPMHRQECFRFLLTGDVGRMCPNADRLASEALSLPVYPELTGSQLDEVIGAISSGLQLS
jgi:dTDP-4-amino-4,6-dideoxygalactose transaminase